MIVEGEETSFEGEPAEAMALKAGGLYLAAEASPSAACNSLALSIPRNKIFSHHVETRPQGRSRTFLRMQQRELAVVSCQRMPSKNQRSPEQTKT